MIDARVPWRAVDDALGPAAWSTMTPAFVAAAVIMPLAPLHGLDLGCGALWHLQRQGGCGPGQTEGESKSACADFQERHEMILQHVRPSVRALERP